MSKRVIIISSSPRAKGNSDTLCDEFVRGAVEAGHAAEKLFLKSMNIGYFYTMCGQLKTFIDRNCFFSPELTGKDFYYIMIGEVNVH